MNNHQPEAQLTQSQLCARIQRFYDSMRELKERIDPLSPINSEVMLDSLMEDYSDIFDDILYFH